MLSASFFIFKGMYPKPAHLKGKFVYTVFEKEQVGNPSYAIIQPPPF